MGKLKTEEMGVLKMSQVKFQFKPGTQAQAGYSYIQNILSRVWEWTWHGIKFGVKPEVVSEFPPEAHIVDVSLPDKKALVTFYAEAGWWKFKKRYEEKVGINIH